MKYTVPPLSSGTTTRRTAGTSIGVVAEIVPSVDCSASARPSRVTTTSSSTCTAFGMRPSSRAVAVG
jgi:hypothetical protein